MEQEYEEQRKSADEVRAPRAPRHVVVLCPARYHSVPCTLSYGALHVIIRCPARRHNVQEQQNKQTCEVTCAG
eukprot:167272-Rhodomonas_salina.1